MPAFISIICCLFIFLFSQVPAHGQQQEEKIYTVSELNTKPQPANGLTAFINEWSKKVKYPKEAIDKNIQGMVFIQFIVNVDGAVTESSIKSGLGHGCDEAALKAFREITKTPWKPGIKNDHPVKVKMVIPFFFRIVVRK